MAKQGRQPEYKKKKVRVVGWVHPDTKAALERAQSKTNKTIGKQIDEMMGAVKE